MDVHEDASLPAQSPDDVPHPEAGSLHGSLEDDIPQEERRTDRLAYMHDLMERFGIQR